jgi:succinate dehydrogenase / fumarate reductase membrane anchor subunit|tara:strand:- start:76940 stop:77314 length:375 start_codon:yes stop_codon:yes gene_type:complete
MGRVTSIASLGRNGLYDWVVQRISALVIAAYFLFIVFFLVANPDLSYEHWHELFSCLWMKVFSTISLLMLLAHTWIGVWSVLTDYMTPRLMGSKANILRLIAELAVLAVILIVAVIGLNIFWSL